MKIIADEQKMNDGEIILLEIPEVQMKYSQDVWRHLKANRLAISGLAVILILILLALAVPWCSHFTYDQQNLSLTNQPPSEKHWFGTDSLGRDLFSRVWYGARITLSIAFVASVICLLIGVFYGGISGFVGGWVDELMMRMLEVLSSIPFLLYVILLMVWMGPGLKAILIALGAVYWLTMARVVRGQILAIKEEVYVQSAKVLGVSTGRILIRHLLPNVMGTIIVTMALMIPDIIFTEAWLSFLGLGVSIPMASWGVLASEGVEGVRNYPWQLFFPAFLISITMLSFNFLGEGLRQALDPRVNS